MEDVKPDVPLGFTSRKCPPGTHMCFVFDSEEERRRIMAKYLGAGLEIGEQVAYFADTTVQSALDWLAEEGVAASTGESRHVKVSLAESVYCPGRRFSPEVMFDTLREFRRESDAAFYDGVRVSGEMGWALRGIPGSDRLLEYEAGVNYVLPETGITAMCQYDANIWDGATILHILRVHPMIVVRGQVVENPYYMTPDEYLRKYCVT